MRRRTLALAWSLSSLSLGWPRLAAADVAAPPRVVVHDDRIELRESIYFDNAKATIKAASQPLLDEIAKTLAGNPWIEVVEVGVHSDERGADAYNLRITADRADAIKGYLVAHGVAALRLQSRGYGETRPLCSEHNEPCWSRNRRVELVVVKSAPHS